MERRQELSEKGFCFSDYIKNKMINSDEFKLAVTNGQEHESHETKSDAVDDSLDLPF